MRRLPFELDVLGMIFWRSRGRNIPAQAEKN